MRAIDLDTELNALGMPFILIGYPTKAPAYPYGIYLENLNVTGDDTGLRRITEHSVTIELYHNTAPGLLAACGVLEKWLNDNALDYRREMTYVVDEGHFVAIFNLDYVTKSKKG